MRSARVVASLVSLALLVAPRASAACSACSSGDPTLTSLGTEKPYAGRLRASAEARHRTDAIGTPMLDRIELSEQRIDLGLAWAPHDRVFLQLTAPFVRREVEYVNLATTVTGGLGDVEVRGKLFFYVDQGLSARHLLSAVIGAKLPTAPRQHDANGDLLPIEVQPGTGSFDPQVGLSYGYFRRPFSIYTSLLGSAPLVGPEDNRASPSLRITLAGQIAVAGALSLRLGVDGRFDGKAVDEGAPSPDSGGFIAFLSPEVLVSPVSDLLFIASLRVPVVSALDGHHDEGLIPGLAVAYDF